MRDEVKYYVKIRRSKRREDDSDKVARGKRIRVKGIISRRGLRRDTDSSKLRDKTPPHSYTLRYSSVPLHGMGESVALQSVHIRLSREGRVKL